MRMKESGDSSANYLDRSLIEEVSEGIHFFNSTSPSLTQYHNRPFFDAEFLYRLKQSLDSYWEDDTLDTGNHYQLAEELINRGSDIHTNISAVPKKRKVTRMDILRRVNNAKAILDSPETIQFDLSVLARECSMSKYFLIRSFKSVFNVTPQKYFIRKKLEDAKKLLGNGLKVSVVARRLGYPDVSAFSKQFKKYEGKPPGSFRPEQLL